MSAPVDREVSALCGYALVQRVAQSYLGPLWVAVDQRDGTPSGAQALVRHVQLPAGTSAVLREGILQAAAEACSLRHENILSATRVLDDGKELGVVYEQVAAEPLRSLQSWANMRGLPIPTGVSLRVAIDLLAALESLHRTHSSAVRFPAFGGLSPDSVLVSKTGETLLCDALVARCAALVEGIGTNPAKLGFCAPEQLEPGAAPTLQGDLFAVGAMLWELLTGRRMFIGSREVVERKLRARELPKLSDVLRGSHLVSPVLVGIVDAALGDASQRCATAHAMAKQLEACGHTVASRHEVSQYVEKLAGQRLERRTASLQSRAAVQRPASLSRPEPPLSRPEPPLSRPEPPLSLPALSLTLAEPSPSLPASSLGRPESSIIIGVQPTEAAFAAAPSSAEAEPPREAVLAHQPLFAPEDEAPPDTEASAPYAGPGQAVDPGPPPAPAPVRPSPAQASRTMIGIGMTADLVAAARAQVAAAAQPAPPVAAAVESPARAAQSSSAVDTPVPSSERHAFSLPPAPPEVTPERASLRAPVARRNRGAARGRAALPRNVAFGVVGAAVALGAVALGISLRSEPEEPGAAVALPMPADVGTASAVAAPQAVALPAPSGQPPEAPAARVNDTAEAEVAGADAQGEPVPAAKSFFVAKLDDSQLAEWFALERQRDLPECSERLGKRSAAKYTGKQTKLSLARLANAKRALHTGKHDTALTELCAATAHDRGNVEAQRTLAELALTLGDAALAKESAERGLAAAKKKKEPELHATLGDALALLGDVPGARKAWLATDTRGSEAQRKQRLAAAYRKAGERAIASGKLTSARIQLRRALVLTQGSYAASVAFAQALLTLEQPRAALAWAERAARALPKNVRAQILLGDAHAANGDHEKARAAWHAALRVQPKNAIAARRLRSGRG